MKNTKRIVLSTLAAAAIFASAAMPASAAQEVPSAVRNHETYYAEILAQLQDKFGTHSRLWDLICSWIPGCPDTEEKPDAPENVPIPPAPEVPESKPDSPDLPAPEVPDNSIPDTPEIDTPPASVHAYEMQVVVLVNAQRAKYGLSPLAISEDLCVKARMKSQDMADHNYFSHTSPTYGSPFDMMKTLGISYRSAGENIAMGYATPEAVVTAWMNSQGHRENILSDKYTTLGVGYVAGGNYWTQWFIG